MKKKLALIITSSAIFASLLMGGTALAQNPGGMHWDMGSKMPGVFGTVNAVNGTALTVQSKGFGPNATQTTYTVDATNATVTKNGSAASLPSVSVGDTVMIQGTVIGTSVTATAIRDGMMGRGMGMKSDVSGTVSAVNGNTLTVTASRGPNNGTTYTVDASNTTVTKNGASSSLSGIAIGDTVMVQGTVSGTNVTATAIRDGMPKGKMSFTSPIQGNGQPVVAGSVTDINGNTLTITNKSNVTYTIDATSAQIVISGMTSTLAKVVVGDGVLVQGTVNGTSVIAASIIDQGSPANTSPSVSGTPIAHRGFMGGFFGAVGGFFQHLFGF